ncbi:MAG: hypothetical protein HKN36_07980 [Hellea sp.]|nr:hypothetical protein [Hellea sp.]
MTNLIDRVMVTIGFSKSDVRSTPHRNLLYAAIAGMAILACLGIALNLGI